MYDEYEAEKHLYNEYEDVVTSLLSDREYKIKASELSCCCPFHEEQHPSFSINLETGLYNCFACNEKR